MRAATAIAAAAACALLAQPGAATCPAYPFLTPVPLPNPLPANVVEAINQVNATLSSVLDPLALPGFAFTAYYAGEKLAAFGGGLANISAPAGGPPSPSSSLFRIASNTKIFMSLLTYVFHARGMLRSLDDPVVWYAPDFRTLPFESAVFGADTLSNVTFRMLASHTSGLPDSLPGLIDWSNITTATAFASIAGLPLQQPMYGFPGYSNLGIALLGHLLSEYVAPPAEQGDVGALIDKYIVGPLGLQNTGYDYTPSVLQRLTPGYYPDGSVVGVHTLGWAAPCGVMYSTVHDLNLLHQTLAGAAAGDAQNALGMSPALAREFLQPISYLPDGSLLVGSPWEQVVVPPTNQSGSAAGGYLVRSKSGTLDGYATKSAVLPELRLSFAFCYNGNFADWYTGDDLLRAVAQALIPAVQAAITPLQPPRATGPPDVAAAVAGNFSQLADPSGSTVATVYADAASGQLMLSIASGTGSGASVQTGTLGYVGTLSVEAAGEGGSGAGGDSSSDGDIRAALLQQRRMRGAAQQHQASAGGGRSAGNRHPLSGERPPHPRGSATAKAARSRHHLSGQGRASHGAAGAHSSGASTSRGPVSQNFGDVSALSSASDVSAGGSASGASAASPMVVMYRWYTDPTAQDCEHVFMGDSPYGWPVLFSAAAAAEPAGAVPAAGPAEDAATASVGSVVVDGFTMVDWTGPWQRVA